ncbi:DUF3034 family protein [Pacificimonas flava]|uniref:DUF3034 domain-containing protein n=1 Tax=Pacificimonas flava TaxID=1234595 RepID=M2TDD3_9SPHN|nr:DUF3034 family protein [Pacificimonas flava]EMD84519.1 hypothetical protein C725_0449 [Pacificimonas flava]MBB5279609.1 hypothetical protein [Pacificimonas flava]
MKPIVPFLLFSILSAGPAAAELRPGGKLLLTNGVTTVEGASGGGLSNWAVIGGNATRDGIGASAHASLAILPDFSFSSAGFAAGLFNRVELSYAHQWFDTGDFGGTLGIGEGYTFDQDIFGAKVRVLGDVVYGSPYVPQIAVGVQHKRSGDDALVTAVGAARPSDTDVYISATKLFLRHSVLANASLRLTRANQTGLLGYGGPGGDDRSLQFEGSLAYQISRPLVVGAEYRTKPSNLAFAEEENWVDLFAAYALTRNLTVTAAYVDLGSIATSAPQRGGLIQLQAAF